MVICVLVKVKNVMSKMVPTKVKRWSALTSTREKHLEVSLYRLTGSKKKQGHYKPASGAGFAVRLISRSDEPKTPCTS